MEISVHECMKSCEKVQFEGNKDVIESNESTTAGREMKGKQTQFYQASNCVTDFNHIRAFRGKSTAY